MANNTTVTISAPYDITNTQARIDVTIANIIPVGNRVTTNAGDWASLSMGVEYYFGALPNIAARRAANFTLRDHTLFPTSNPAPGYGGGTSYILTGVLLTRGSGASWNGTINVRAFSRLNEFTGTGTSVTSDVNNSTTQTFSFSLPGLSASFVKTDVTVNGASDGTIVVTPSGGSGNYSFSWADSAVTTATRTGLSANNYTVVVTDTTTLQSVSLNITISEPGVVVPDPTPAFFDVPKMQSLQFVVSEVIDNCSTFQSLDNRLFCEQDHAFFTGLQYEQLVQNCDSFSIQFRSSYSDISISLQRSVDDVQVATYTATRIVEGLNNEQSFDVRMQDNGSSSTRVYFVGFSAPPVVVNVGDTFALFNTSNSIDNNYEVVNVLLDSTNNQQYLVINANYGSTNSSETGEAQFTTTLLPFDIYEFQVDFSAIPIELYKIVITVRNPSQTRTFTATSEPIRVAVTQPNTLFLQWSNRDNAFDIDYSNNIVHQIRVEGVFFQRLPNAERQGIREIAGDYQLLFAKPRRRVRAEFLRIPPYMQEKLAVIFLNDSVRLNGILVNSESGLEEPIYTVRFGLSNSTIIVEQLDWFNNYNTDDPGGVDLPQTAFILRDTNAFIRR